MKHGARTTLATALTLGALLLALPSASAASDPVTYVALGDSFASAPFVTPADPGNPGCLRSLVNYPHTAAKALGATLTDVSCAGATVEDLSAPQAAGTPAQYAALTPATDIVSLTIGGNDTGLFTAALGCTNLLPEPLGSSCADRNTQGGTDVIDTRIDAWAPKFAAVLDTIRRLAPHAQVFAVSGGSYIRSGGCFPSQPVWGRDATYLQSKIDHLAAVVQQATEAHGDTFVGATPLTAGHDICAAPADRYIEGFVPASPAAPLHPNAKGSAAVGIALAAAVERALSPAHA
ncbi:SGNH/GDSL hydrolase family protein [Actinacidiphila paucisporea]|uniref:GDSL-like Lipase/Acylhydrolase family protein n=1 Tax=Actinacidiphila paucisporea TaxID=310782 RepID=A0A1M7QTP9_9ACTN|nr:SGNH/GDSL hydrolase family protein [Actinacidiphila paucisporea]SHN35235.1 GDSL-like Lipase/Acylhydrolase family protein [Actinacidiphila paucisporea]